MINIEELVSDNIIVVEERKFVVTGTDKDPEEPKIYGSFLGEKNNGIVVKPDDCSPYPVPEPFRSNNRELINNISGVMGIPAKFISTHHVQNYLMYNFYYPIRSLENF